MVLARSLISSRQFIKTHMDQNKTSKMILISDSKTLYSLRINELNTNPNNNNDEDLMITGTEITFPLVQHPIKWETILGPCNGLVLAKDEDDTIFLMNLTTQELRKVPSSPFALPFDESFVMHGFGYNPCTQDYHVITISFWDETENEHHPDYTYPDYTYMYVNIYSLRENSWRELSNSPYDHAFGNLTSCVLVNESLHWLTSRRPCNTTVIAAFSLVNEEFYEIKYPHSLNNGNGVFNELVFVGGKLGIFGARLGNHLWLIEDYGVKESWIKICLHGVEIDTVKPICFVDGSDRDVVSGDEDGIVVYNMDDTRCRNLGIAGGPNGFSIGGPYVESVKSPRCI